MIQEPHDVAWAIVSKTQDIVSRASGSKSLLLNNRELIRLASLNFVVSRIIDSLSIETDSSVVFTKSSIENRALKISNDQIEDTVSILENKMAKRLIAQINIENINDVLGWIHTYACHMISSRGLSTQSRRVSGAVYTPTSLANRITEQTLGPRIDELIHTLKETGPDALNRISGIQIIDPACGTGTFLISAVQTMKKRWKTLLRVCENAGFSKEELRASHLIGPDATPAGQLFGVDLDEAALEIAELSLAIEMKKDYGSTNNECITLRQGNSLISLTGMNGSGDFSNFFSKHHVRNAFEWLQEFKGITPPEGLGFDILLMNPPYIRLKPNLAEYIRTRLIEGVRKVSLEEFDAYKERLKEDVNYFRKSKEYRLANVHTIDTYRLFIERALQITSDTARLGFVVPATILGDLSATKLRTHLLNDNQVLIIEEYPEKARIFPHITQSICSMVVEKGSTSHKIILRYNIDSIDTIRHSSELSLNDIKLIMGESCIIPRLSKREITILKKIHSYSDRYYGAQIENWRGEFDLTNDKEYLTTSPSGLSLIRGAQIERYGLKQNKHPEFVDFEEFRKTRSDSQRITHIESRRIACQQISNRNQRWRLKWAFVEPNQVLANSCNYITMKKMTASLSHYLLGILNSELINWRFHLANSNNHVSNRELSVLPLLNPLMLESDDQNYYRDISKFARRLLSGRKDLAQSIDALVFHIYGISESDASVILTSRNTPNEERDCILGKLRSFT